MDGLEVSNNGILPITKESEVRKEVQKTKPINKVVSPITLNAAPQSQRLCFENVGPTSIDLTGNELCDIHSKIKLSNKRHTYDQKNELQPDQIKKIPMHATVNITIIENVKIIGISNLGNKIEDTEIVIEDSVKSAEIEQKLESGILEVHFDNDDRFVGQVLDGVPNGFGMLILSNYSQSLVEALGLDATRYKENQILISGNFVIEQGNLVRIPFGQPQPSIPKSVKELDSATDEVRDDYPSPELISADITESVDCILAFTISKDDQVEKRYQINYLNGDAYQGCLQNDKPHGSGLYTPLGEKGLFGEWYEGKLGGSSVEARAITAFDEKLLLYAVEYSNGDSYIGEMFNGLPHGWGCLSREGQKFLGTWRWGMLPG